MPRIRMLSLVFALLAFVSTARSYAAGEVQLLRAKAFHNLGRTPAEALFFDILVKNLAYDKHITIHLDDGTGTVTDLEGKYVRVVDSQTEVWQAAIQFYDPSSAPTATYTFSVEYAVSGATYLDDNDGKKYTFHVNNDALLITKPVLLDVATSYPPYTDIFGQISVQNLGYEKKVNIVYTTDNWLTVQSTPAQYSLGPWAENAEQWQFVLVGVAHLPVQFAISCEVGGVTYWDNNYGQNYKAGTL